MLKNYIKTTMRSLMRSKSNTIINILGLALGITSSLVLFLLLNHLKSFDKFHANYDNIYRIVTESDGQGGNRAYTGGVPTPLPDAIREDFSDLKEVLFISSVYGDNLISTKNGTELKTFYEDDETRMAYTEQGYFTLFDFKLLTGNRQHLLDQPNKVVISERLAKRYFGDSDPLNKVLILNKTTDLVVSGVMENVPDNTDFPFEILISYATIKPENVKSGWGSISSDNQCYVLLAPNQNPENLNAQFPNFIKKYIDEKNEDNRVMYLQPLSNLHFNEEFSNYSYNSISNGNLQAIGIIALFLLATSCVNFVNLSTAVAVKRAKEVGIRKVLGSTKSQLVRQFLGETFFITLVSIGISMGLTEAFLLYINPFLEVKLDLALLSNANQLLFIVSLLVGITLVAGIYPAFVLSSYKPVVALKSKLVGKGSSGQGLRKGLVIFQFFISQVFIIGTIILITQVNYVRNAELGFNPSAVIDVSLPIRKDNDKKRTLKNKLQQIAAVESVSLALSDPSSGSVSITNVHVQDDPESYDVSVKLADENYIVIYGIKLLAGRGLPARDTLSEMVVNEEFLRVTGIKSPEEAIGKQIKIWGTTVPIVGVMNNFHTVSLHEKIAPVVLFNGINNYRLASIKINTKNIAATIPMIEDVWKELYPDYDFDYKFVDAQIAEFYEGEQKMSTIFAVFAGIAIFIGCLGLYGLASYTVNQKVKEIGVRKVLGAKVSQILYMFSREFLTLVVIAFVLAAPLAWYIMNQWLQGFEYRINIGPLIFISSVFITAVIAVATVGYKSMSAAMANPVDSLRDE
ncbi:MAG TPA: ABC transporter permease [Fulvivirga sp.]|nr:ABC transporter permease [Fulvivirga sp.]